METILEARRTIILNGVASFADRNDLADSCLFIELKTIECESGLPEADTSNKKQAPDI